MGEMGMRKAITVGVGVIVAACMGCSDFDRLRAKAMLGGVDSQVELGNRYGTGNGVEQSEAEAVRWYRRAAAGGHAPSQLVMGNRYASGIGVEEDATESYRSSFITKALRGS